MRKRLLSALLAGVSALITQPTLAGARTGPEVKIDPERLRASVTKLLVDFAPRSYEHAKSHANAKVKVRGAISLETMGYYRDEDGGQHFPATGLSLLDSTKANYLAVVDNVGQIRLTRTVKSAMQSASPLTIFSINAPVAIPGIDFSDHLNYWRFGYPAVMVTDTAMNRNSNYHTSTDTADTLDYPWLAQATAGVFEAIWRLSAR